MFSEKKTFNQSKKAIFIEITLILLLWMNVPLSSADSSFSYHDEISETRSLFLYSPVIEPSTGLVTLNGGDTGNVSIPFMFDWGDGSIDEGWFPQEHVYSDTSINYFISVTARYDNNEEDTVEALVRFVSPQVSPIALPSTTEVTIPQSLPELSSRMPGYTWSSDLTFFDSSFFDIVPRATIEYVLSVAASLQFDLVNNDVFLPDGEFKQVLLRDPSFGGMYSLWFTTPVSFGVGDYGFQGGIGWSSFFHEMGHNFTLNSPADYYYGGKIDGKANAIFSETLAQIFQHVATAEIIDNHNDYGLPDDLIFEIKESALGSFHYLKGEADNYVTNGKNFSSWNDPLTPEDETLGTFMTLAYHFFQKADESALGYRNPLKYMMLLLQLFDEDLQNQYSQSQNSPNAESFRSTLMVAAMSFGFNEDLRQEFRDLNFPIDDSTFDSLIAAADEGDINVNPGWNLISLSQQPPDTAIASVLSSISGKYLSVWAYINGGWKVYDPNNPGFSDLTTMEAGKGYWINMTEAARLSVSGSAPSNSIDLANGWNLVGYNSSTSQGVADALASISGKYVSVWAYVNGSWKVYDPNNPGFSDLTAMDPGYGYWINATEACTWTLP